MDELYDLLHRLSGGRRSRIPRNEPLGLALEQLQLYLARRGAVLRDEAVEADAGMRLVVVASGSPCPSRSTCLFKPRGPGQFPLIVELHGRAWCRGDRLNDAAINEPLAKSGVVVAALDFRMPPEAPYPASLADINYAIRWLKTRATALGSRPDLVGVLGISSGAHQAMLGGMRPHDPRYAAIPLPAGAPTVDASVRCVVLCWPVIDPLARYHYARKLKAGGQPYPEVMDRVLPLHDQYWRTEEAMAEGNPVLALERLPCQCHTS